MAHRIQAHHVRAEWVAVKEMSSPMTSLNEHFPAVPESIPLARRALTDFAARAGGSTTQIDDVRLAVSEALTNAVVHGYADEPGAIHISAASVSGDLWVLVSDDGCGLRVRTERPGLGLGMALIAEASDEFTIVPSAQRGTELRMRFTLGSAAVSGGRRGPGMGRALPGPAFLAAQAN
jgi:anti-sigma regulatory factor (Ser/Thr protein kinase)